MFMLTHREARANLNSRRANRPKNSIVTKNTNNIYKKYFSIFTEWV